MKYSKKPIVIDAEQYDGTNIDQLIEWSEHNIDWDYYQKAWVVHTLNGNAPIKLYDYVIRGTHDYYPCDRLTFEVTYEQLYHLQES